MKPSTHHKERSDWVSDIDEFVNLQIHKRLWQIVNSVVHRQFPFVLSPHKNITAISKIEVSERGLFFWTYLDPQLFCMFWDFFRILLLKIAVKSWDNVPIDLRVVEISFISCMQSGARIELDMQWGCRGEKKKTAAICNTHMIAPQSRIGSNLGVLHKERLTNSQILELLNEN